MKNHFKTDVLIIGGSYAGLSAAMALGRALRNSGYLTFTPDSRFNV